MPQEIAQIVLAKPPPWIESEAMTPCERRASKRERLSLLLRLDSGRNARTRDIGVSGAYVVMPSGTVVTKGMSYVLTLEAMRLRASVVARVTRIDRLASATGVALRFQTIGISPQ